VPPSPSPGYPLPAPRAVHARDFFGGVPVSEPECLDARQCRITAVANRAPVSSGCCDSQSRSSSAEACGLHPGAETSAAQVDPEHLILGKRACPASINVRSETGHRSASPRRSVRPAQPRLGSEHNACTESAFRYGAARSRGLSAVNQIQSASCPHHAHAALKSHGQPGRNLKIDASGGLPREPA
jgi:hypothetical protein